MAYALTGQKPHVQTASQQLGQRFGIRTIYGVRPDSIPDHPSGVASDFMISDIPNGSAVGQALADFAVANATAFSIKYVIWNRRIWSRARASEGWRPYTSTSNPHTDHVHITFEATPLGAIPMLDGTVQTAYPGQDIIEKIGAVFTRLDSTVAKVSDRGLWARIGLMALGALLLLLVLNKLSGGRIIPGGKS